MQVSQSDSVTKQRESRKIGARRPVPKGSTKLGSAARRLAFLSAMAVTALIAKESKAEDATPDPPRPTCPDTNPLDRELPCQQEGEEAPRCAVSACTGSEATLTLGDVEHSAYVVNREGVLPEIEVDGPAVVELRFYPALRLTDYNHTGGAEVHVSFTVTNGGEGDRPHSFGGEVRSTPMQATDSTGHDLLPMRDGRHTRAIATPVFGTLPFESEGRRTIAFHENGSGEVPFGFLVVRISRPAPVEEPEEVPETVDPEPIVVPVAEPQPQPEPVVEPEEPLTWPLVSVEGEMTYFPSLGSDTLSADVYSAEVLGGVWHNDDIAVLAGAAFSTFGMPFEAGELYGSLRSYSALFLAGLEFRRGRHRVRGGGSVGYRGMRSDGFSVLDDSVADDIENSVEYGGFAAYELDPYLLVRVMGSNSITNPLSATIHGEAPAFRWTGDEGVSLDVEFRWMHSPVAHEDVDGAGALEIGQNNYYLRITGAFPIYDVAGIFMPSVLLGTDMNITGSGLDWAEFLAGVGLEFNLSEAVQIGARGMLSIPGLRPVGVFVTISAEH